MSPAGLLEDSVKIERARMCYQVKLSALSALLLAVFFALFSKISIAASVFLGGLIWFIPNIYFAYRLFIAIGSLPPKRMIKQFYLAEIIKILLSVFFIIIVISFFTVQAIPLFIGYLVTQFVFWLTPLLTEYKN